MKETLPTALALMFGHEGGYSNRSTDAGGPTKYGVTAKTLGAHRGLGRPATASEVKVLTLAEAEDVYRRSYWTQSGGDLLPAGLDYEAFDFGVNSGPGTAVRKLQKVLGVGQDGIVGGQTLDAVNRYAGGLNKLIRDYAAERMVYLRSLGGKQGWSANGRGWTIRVTGKDPKGIYKDAPGVVGNALRLAVNAAPITPLPSEPVVESGTAKPESGTAKAPPSVLGLTETLKKPESWGPLGGLLSAMGAITAGSGPLQWALAVCVVIGVGYGVWRLVKRDRAAA